jgi:hypothetical protein
MSKYLSIIGLFLCFNIQGQDTQLIDLIRQSIKFYEPNPIHFDKSDELNKIFQGLLKDSIPDSLTLKKDASELLSDYKDKIHEDALDTRRIEMRLCISLCSQSLLAGKEKYIYFLELARITISDSKGHAHKFLEQPLCGILFLKIYFDRKYNLDSGNDIKKLKRELKFSKKALEEEFYVSANQWIRMQEHNS